MMINLQTDGFNGNANSGVMIVAAGASVRLPDIPCRAIKLSRWNVTDDEQFTTVVAGPVEEADIEVYYGFNGVLFAPLFPGRETDILPINNANIITLRAPAKVGAAVAVHYVCFQ